MSLYFIFNRTLDDALSLRVLAKKGRYSRPRIQCPVFVFAWVPLSSLLRSCLLPTFVRAAGGADRVAPSGGRREDRPCSQALGLRVCLGGQTPGPVTTVLIHLPCDNCTGGS